MNIGEFKKLIKGYNKDCEIKMSCMTKEGTIKYPESANSGKLFYCSDGFTFDIDFDNKLHCYLKDFNDIVEKENLSDEEQLISWDNDDGNIIQLEGIYILDNVIILY